MITPRDLTIASLEGFACFERDEDLEDRGGSGMNKRQAKAIAYRRAAGIIEGTLTSGYLPRGFDGKELEFDSADAQRVINAIFEVAESLHRRADAMKGPANNYDT
jgi:hypothetical protein